MVNELKSGDAFTRAAARVRAQREAARTRAPEEPITLNAPVIRTSTQVRARLNVAPDETTLASLVDQALSALSRGIRWARGSIINLIV